jgi:deoxyribonuclease-1-like protein
MFLIRRRWTALTAFLAGAAYILNNYSIEGLEQLKLKPRTSAEIAQRRTAGEDWPVEGLTRLTGLQPPGNAVLGLPSTSGPIGNPVSGAFSPGLPQSAMEPLPQFGNNVPRGLTAEADLGKLLSVGEKMAIWEDKNILVKSLSGTQGQGGSLRIGSFHVSSLGSAKLAKPHVAEMLVRILRQFDVVALQGIQSTRDDIMPLLVERLNQSGRAYDYIIGPRVGRPPHFEQFAFVFDTQRLETDRFQLYTVEDPEDLITREPLVAWFRSKAVAPQNAFTFSLINISIEQSEAERERQILPNLIQAIEQDGRGEDDWILLGNFAGGDAELYSLSKIGARIALNGVPTATDGYGMFDNIVCPGAATIEFSGKVGAFDFLRQFNLSLEQALEVSDRLPIWAEFSVREGAEPGRIAPVTDLH